MFMSSIFDNESVRFTIAETGEVIPSEIGVVRMSIQDGVVSRYNQMIGPGTLPVGYKSDAKVGRGVLIYAVVSYIYH